MKLKPTLALAALSLGLSACGGGSKDEVSFPTLPQSADDVPTSAKQSSVSYTYFATTLSKSETAKPLDISKTTPPTSETDAPVAL